MKRGQCILLVDDDAEYGKTLERHLKRTDYRLRHSVGLHQTCAVIQASCRHDRPPEYDIVIAGADMPYMVGIELLDWIKLNCPTVSVILLSGIGYAQIIRERLRPDYDAYAQKPISPFELLELIEKVTRWKTCSFRLHAAGASATDHQRGLK